MLRSGAYDVLSRLECMLRNGGRGVWRLTALLYQCDSGLHCTLLLLQCQWAVCRRSCSWRQRQQRQRCAAPQACISDIRRAPAPLVDVHPITRSVTRSHAGRRRA